MRQVVRGRAKTPFIPAAPKTLFSKHFAVLRNDRTASALGRDFSDAEVEELYHLAPRVHGVFHEEDVGRLARTAAVSPARARVFRTRETTAERRA